MAPLDDDTVSYYTVDSMDTFDTDDLFCDDDDVGTLLAESTDFRLGGTTASAMKSSSSSTEIYSEDDDDCSVDSEINRIVRSVPTLQSRGMNKLTDVSPTYPRRTYSVSPPVNICVTFPSSEDPADFLQVRNVESVLNMVSTEEEFAGVWFTRQELDATMQECTATVKALRGCCESGPQDSPSALGGTMGFLTAKLEQQEDELTDRGLEYVTEHGFDMSRNSMPVVQAVLKEQRRLREERASATAELAIVKSPRPPLPKVLSTKLDPGLLATVSSRSSSHRQRIAHLTGLRDAQEVNQNGNRGPQPAHHQTTSGRKVANQSRRGRQVLDGGVLPVSPPPLTAVRHSVPSSYSSSSPSPSYTIACSLSSRSWHGVRNKLCHRSSNSHTTTSTTRRTLRRQRSVPLLTSSSVRRLRLAESQ